MLNGFGFVGGCLQMMVITKNGDGRHLKKNKNVGQTKN
jgi:hypothetical protein